MTSLTLTYQAIRDSKIKSLSLNINWKVIYIVGAISVFSMIVYYIFLVNELTKGTYLIKSFGKEINVLLEENRTLEATSTKSGMLTKTMEKASELSFEKTKNIKYIQILESSLAKAK